MNRRSVIKALGLFAVSPIALIKLLSKPKIEHSAYSVSRDEAYAKMLRMMCPYAFSVAWYIQKHPDWLNGSAGKLRVKTPNGGVVTLCPVDFQYSTDPEAWLKAVGGFEVIELVPWGIN